MNEHQTFKNLVLERQKKRSFCERSEEKPRLMLSTYRDQRSGLNSFEDHPTLLLRFKMYLRANVLYNESARTSAIYLPLVGSIDEE